MTFFSKVYELDNVEDNCDEDIEKSAPTAFERNGGEGNVWLDGIKFVWGVLLGLMIIWPQCHSINDILLLNEQPDQLTNLCDSVVRADV